MSVVCCFVCKRYREPGKMDGNRCVGRVGCYRVAARLRGRRISKRAARMFAGRAA